MGSTEPMPFEEPDEAARSAPPLPFPVVGIGGSAGALAALRVFFEHMPARTGMAFVIVLHLSPEHGSELDSILQRSTRMPVLQVSRNVPIAADHVYVISPAQQLSMAGGHLCVEPAEQRISPPVAIDVFFRSLAAAHRSHSVCVVLSGIGSDGSVGIKRIVEEGGVALVQSPDDAEFPDMPQSAIATGVVDFVLPAVDLPQKLVDLWSNAQQIELPAASDGDAPASPRPIGAADPLAQVDAALQEVLAGLQAHTGNDFSHYKRATVLRRLERRMQVRRVPTLQAYRAALREQPQEYAALQQDLLISVTSFFRDREAFDAVERQLQTHPAESIEPRRPLRAWVPACATGEEAYSVAMLLWERFATPAGDRPIQVFASDIDERAIGAARLGRYAGSIVTDVAPARLRQFFVLGDGHYRVRKELRDLILFSVHNVLRDPPFSRLDLVCCRNLLIYLDRDVQKRILQTFHFGLRPGGLLFLGSSESTEAAPGLFELVDRRWRIFRALAQPGRGAPARPGLPSLPVAQPPPKLAQSELSQLHARLLAETAPASVLIDALGNLLHISDQAAQFLHHPDGAPAHRLLDLIRPELRLALRTALSRARQIGASVEAPQAEFEHQGCMSRVRIVATPCADSHGEASLMLVRFIQVSESLAVDAPLDGSAHPLMHALERELQLTRDRLQGSLGVSEASGEELRASNEELQAINEELRSATEELETSKEELQAVNEELISLNDELRSRAEETDKLNDDLTNFIASTDIATVFVDRALRIRRYTPPATNLFNLLPTDVGRPLLDITSGLDYPQLVSDASDAFSKLRQVDRELRSHDDRHFLARVLPYRTHADQIAGAVLTFIDVSALRRAESQLRLGELHMRLVAESATDFAIITLDLKGRVTHWSKGAERLFGYSDAEMLGSSLEAIFLPEDRAAGAHRHELLCARSTGRALDERWHLRKDGSRLYCSGITTTLNDGELQGYAKIARDRTEARLADVQREALLASEKQLRTELQRASTLKDEFLAVMSHELKHPLNLIHVNAELLTRLPEARNHPAVARAANVIRRTVFSQAKIIDDLLDLSRLHTGKLSLSFARIDWAGIIERVVEAVRPDAEAKGLELVTGLDSRAAMVMADWVRVEQIIWNLLSNALKFTPRGGRVRVGLAIDGDSARLDVADTGRGIDPAFIANVFDMFRQASAGPARQEGGLGIGLALVRHLAEQHGGRVAAASEGLGRGACLSVWLPLAADNSQLLPAQEPPALGGLRVLIVDDTADTLEAFTSLLQIEGATVTTATSGEEALASVADAGAVFDLIISDVGMPGMDGYQLASRLRQLESTCTLPLIALTGFGQGSDTKRVLAAGFDAHLTKPVSLDRLLRTIERLRLRARESGR